MIARMASPTATARKRAQSADHASDDSILASYLLRTGCRLGVNDWLRRRRPDHGFAGVSARNLHKDRTMPQYAPLVSLRSERDVAWRAGPVVGPAEVSHASPSEYAPAAQGLGRGVWRYAVSYPARPCRLSVR